MSRLDKERENAAALSVLPDLLQELDSKPQDVRLLALVSGEGCRAWGAARCMSQRHAQQTSQGHLGDLRRAV